MCTICICLYVVFNFFFLNFYLARERPLEVRLHTWRLLSLCQLHTIQDRLMSCNGDNNTTVIQQLEQKWRVGCCMTSWFTVWTINRTSVSSVTTLWYTGTRYSCWFRSKQRPSAWWLLTCCWRFSIDASFYRRWNCIPGVPKKWSPCFNFAITSANVHRF